MGGGLMSLVALGKKYPTNITYNLDTLSIDLKFYNTLNDCSICLEDINQNDVIVLCGQCINYFHKDCCSKMSTMNCPACRTFYNVTSPKLFKVITSAKLFEIMTKKKNNKINRIIKIKHIPNNSVFNGFLFTQPKKKYTDKYNKKSNRFFTKGNHCEKI